MFCQSVLYFSFDNSHFITIWYLAQPKVNRDLVCLGVNFTDIDINGGYATWSKSKGNSPLHWAGTNNLLPFQNINSDHGAEALTGVTTALSLSSLPKNNSTCMNLSQNSTRKKCYFHHKQNHFLDHFEDPVPDGAVICGDGVPFQYNEWEGKYMVFVGNPTGIIFVATNRDHEFWLNQKGNESNISNSSNNFRRLNFAENSSNLIQVTPQNPGDTLHQIYNARKRDTDADYWSRVKKY